MLNEIDRRFEISERWRYKEMEPPNLNYLPAKPNYPAHIAVIGCGSESFQFLTAYLRADYDVVALCDPDPEKARRARDAFYPTAKVFTDYRRILDDAAINFVVAVVESGDSNRVVIDCLRAGKHVLNQKYTVNDLDEGEALARIAGENKAKLAVNTDARWSPSWRYATQLIREGYIGNVKSLKYHAIWNHNWIKGIPFENEKYCLMRYFGMYWFDVINDMMNNVRAKGVRAVAGRSLNQQVKPPLLNQVMVEYPSALACLLLDGDSPHFSMDYTFILGDEGAIVSEGPDRSTQRLWFISRNRICCPELDGDWLPGGFHGAMAELISSVEEDREPENSSSCALEGLALCFAAVASAEHGHSYAPGEEGARSFISIRA